MSRYKALDYRQILETHGDPGVRALAACHIRQKRGRGKGHSKKVAGPATLSEANHGHGGVRELAALANTSRTKGEQAIWLYRHGSNKLKHQVLCGEITFLQAIKELKPDATKPNATGSSEIIELLQLIRKLAFEPLQQEGAMRKRAWNMDNASKLVLAQGLKRILAEVETRLASLQVEHSTNTGNSVKHRRSLNRPARVGLESSELNANYREGPRDAHTNQGAGERVL